MSYKKTKKMIFAIVLVLILIAAYFVVTIVINQKTADEEEKKRQEAENAIVLSVAPDQIESISFGSEGEEVLFVHEGTEWNIPGDSDFHMNEGKIKLLTADLGALRADRELENPGELSEYGIREDSKKIVVNLVDSQKHEIKLGERNKTTNQLYFLLDGNSEKIYLTSTSLDQHFSGTAQNFASYEEFPSFTPMQLRKVSVDKDEDSYVIDMPGDDTCAVSDQKGTVQKADLNIVGIVQNNLSNISWAENLEYSCKDFSVYGLDEPACSINVEYTQNQTPYNFSLNVGNCNEKNNYYVRMDNSKEVHSIRAEYIEQLVMGTAENFWNLSYSFVSIGDIDSLEVTADQETHILSCENIESEDLAKWFIDGVETDKKTFNDFYYACASVTAQERLNSVPDIKQPPVLELIYHLKDGTTKEIRYYAEDQNFYTVIYENGTKAAHTNKIYVNTMLENLQNLIKRKKSE